MSVVNVTLGDGKKLNLPLGRQGENEVTAVVFDFSAWATEFGSGTLSLSVQRHGDELPYAVTMTTSGTNATWTISDLDTAYKGTGEAQVKYTVGTKVKKSAVYKFTVNKSLGQNGEYPSPGQTWQEEIEDELDDVKQDLSDIESDVYDPLSVISYTGYDSGRALKPDGKSTNSESVILSYPVTEGDVLYLSLTNIPNGLVLFFFQNTSTVPWSGNTNIIGTIHTESQFNGYVKVPTGATYLVLNRLITNSSNIVKKATRPMNYHGVLAGAITNAQVGVYSVDSNSVTGLPSNMTQRYGWLTCYVPNSLYILVESNTSKTTWLKEGSSDWVQTFPVSSYYGTLTGAYTNAKTGTYAVSSANVTGLPSGMSQLYGWLTCYVPNQLYVLVESNTSKTTWLKEGGSDWIKVYPRGTTGNSRLQDKLIAYNGDSICESRFSGFSSNGGGYPYLISQIVGGTYENKGVSGGTLAVSSAGHHVCETISTMTDNADVVCLEGGINDYWLNVPLGDFSPSDFTGTIDNTTICGALESIFRQAINKWVGKPIVFIIVHKITTTAWTQNTAGYTFAQAREKMIGICEKYSIPYLDMWSQGGLNAYMSALDNAFLNGGSNTHPDGCHPDVNGYKKYYVPRLISMFESLLPYED